MNAAFQNARAALRERLDTLDKAIAQHREVIAERESEIRRIECEKHQLEAHVAGMDRAAELLAPMLAQQPSEPTRHRARNAVRNALLLFLSTHEQGTLDEIAAGCAELPRQVTLQGLHGARRHGQIEKVGDAWRLARPVPLPWLGGEEAAQ